MKNLENTLVEIFNSIVETIQIFITKKVMNTQPVYVPINKPLKC